MRKKLFRHMLAMLIFLAMSAFFFWPHLEGKKVFRSDWMQYLCMTQEIFEFETKTGFKPLWTNAMFGGMPTYQINPPHRGNYLDQLDWMLRLGGDSPIGVSFVSMLGCYILLLILRVDFKIAIIGAITFALSTNNIILFGAGHYSKLKAISYLPLLTSGLILAFQHRFIWGFFVFAIGCGLHLLANHLQVTYYFFLTLPLLLVPKLIQALRTNQLPDFLRASMILLVALLLAIGSSLTNLWTTYEYSKETIRGNSILNPSNMEGTDSRTVYPHRSGLGWEYSMEFSNGMIDLLASVIPSAAGSSTEAKLVPGSRMYENLKKQGVSNPSELKAPLYWGALPFTSAPVYLGAVVIFLFIIGLYVIDGPIKWWLGIGTLLCMLLSLGKNFQYLNEFIFNHLPLYNRFRAPNSIMAITPLMMTMLASLAIDRILKSRDKQTFLPVLKKVGFRFVIPILMLAIVGPYLFDFFSANDLQNQMNGLNTNDLIEDRRDMFRSDGLRSFILMACAFILLYAFIKNKIPAAPMLLGLGILATFDFWMIDRRFIDNESFQDQVTYQKSFDPRGVDKRILQDPDPNFRVLDRTINTFSSSTASYFHKTIGGYHAAKLRRYQDVIDRYLLKGDSAVLNMLNAKYVIDPGEDGIPYVWKNQSALGNAWVVDSIAFVASINEEFEGLGSLDPAQVALVHQEYQAYLEGLEPTRSGEISLVDYIPDHLTYKVACTKEILAVFSEIWYGPDLGWQVYIDGKPVSHIRTNYLLRALRIPAGDHLVEFIFQPESFYKGRIISRIASSLIIWSFLWFIGLILIRSIQPRFGQIRS